MSLPTDLAHELCALPLDVQAALHTQFAQLIQERKREERFYTLPVDCEGDRWDYRDGMFGTVDVGGTFYGMPHLTRHFLHTLLVHASKSLFP